MMKLLKIILAIGTLHQCIVEAKLRREKIPRSEYGNRDLQDEQTLRPRKPSLSDASLPLSDPPAEVKIYVQHDDYPSETAWTLTDAAGNVMAYQSEDDAVEADEEVSVTLYLPAGTYSFTITDEYGDGICCTYGNGSYSITVNGEVVANGSKFEETETKTFEVMANTEQSVERSPGAPSNYLTQDNNEDPTEYPTDSPTDAPTDAPTDSPTGSPVDVTFYIDFYYDDYPSETAWFIREKGADVNLIGKPASDYIPPSSEVTESVALQDGVTYVLTITDTYGDGICCGQSGNGKAEIYAIVDGEKQVIASSDGQFEDEQNTEFTVDMGQFLSPEIAVVDLVLQDNGDENYENDVDVGDVGMSPRGGRGGHISHNTNSCDDSSDKTFFVNQALPAQNCDWLRLAGSRYDYLCDFVDVVIACPNTCGQCDLFG